MITVTVELTKWTVELHDFLCIDCKSTWAAKVFWLSLINTTISTNFKFIRPPYVVLILCNAGLKRVWLFSPPSVRTNRSDSSSQFHVWSLYINTSLNSVLRDGKASTYPAFHLSDQSWWYRAVLNHFENDFLEAYFLCVYSSAGPGHSPQTGPQVQTQMHNICSSSPAELQFTVISNALPPPGTDVVWL